MSKEINTKQMSLLGDSHANHSQLQGKEKEQMTIDTSGMKLLESSENVNQNGSLAKMLKVLLTSKKAWYSDRCKLTWKKKVSKSNVLLYQLQASVLGIKEKESGKVCSRVCKKYKNKIIFMMIMYFLKSTFIV